MNTTAIFSSEHSWSRRSSTETVFSIQGKETDLAADTSDTEGSVTGSNVEYEPVTEPEDDGPVDDDTSAQSDNDIIATKVIEVSVGDDGELQLADSEQTDSYESDSEIDLHDYWYCAQCRAKNNNPLYRYCQKCFKVRKNFFPPRPKRKRRDTRLDPEVIPTTLSQDSGVETLNSQESQLDSGEGCSQSISQEIPGRSLKRRIEFPQSRSKRRRLSETDSDSDTSKTSDQIKPLMKTVSDPSITIDDVDVKLTKRVIADSIKEKLESSDLCVICISEPKSGVFVHVHGCCLPISTSNSLDINNGLLSFNQSCLKDVDTNEKIVLPSAEDVAAEKTQKSLFDGIEKFDASRLKHTETQEKNPLPDKDVVAAEKAHQNLLEGVEHFDKAQMKHTTTEEKNPLPPIEAIEAEKEKNKFLNGIENFDPTKLKHTKTCEKNPLPTKDIIEQEKTA
ncbi:hypothetical protein K1T71_001042 [Dendrolimus kikuchii]|uniref:Uncharacterized protein n=1 Tax=Dendrolimus kikuchii TaxID=765133 RepID=A0ACC1DGT8_9NEOP|nr:hypothetical protein K1T71_001042 [Dendrolimus kikuchii]